MDCQDVQGFIDPYLDGEFAEQDSVAYAAHLASCEACRKRVAFEQAFRDKLRRSTARPARAPVALAARVRQALDEAERPAGWAVRGLRWLIPAAVTAMLLVAAVVADRRELQPQQVAGGADNVATLGGAATASSAAAGALSLPQALAESSVQWHRRVDLPLDVRASSVNDVRGFFSNKVPFAVRPPHFKRARAHLVGGRLANLRQYDAAYLLYKVQGRRVSVFIFDQSALRGSGAGQHARKPTRSIRWRRLRGYNVGFFSSGGTGYAVASDMEPEQLVRLISW